MIIDSDVIAREIVAPGTPGLAALVDAFGSEILDAEGNLQRPVLAAKAFRDDESRNLLNSITHPRVGQRTAELLAAAAPDAIVVQDVPLLVENGMAPLVQLVLVVDVAAQTRLRRLVQSRGVDEDDARARIAAQATDEQRYAAADVLLDNNGPEGRVQEQVHRLWEQRLVPFEANMRAGRAAAARLAIVPSDPQWSAQAQRVIARLRVAAGAAAQRIDHIGATAVPGVPSLDLLDLQITVADHEAATALPEALAGAGFPVAAESARLGPDPVGETESEAEYCPHGNADPGRPVQIWIRTADSPSARFGLDFPEWLRAEPAARAEYAAVAREAVAAAAGLDGAAAARAYRAVLQPWYDSVYRQVVSRRTGGPA